MGYEVSGADAKEAGESAITTPPLKYQRIRITHTDRNTEVVVLKENFGKNSVDAPVPKTEVKKEERNLKEELESEMAVTSTSSSIGEECENNEDQQQEGYPRSPNIPIPGSSKVVMDSSQSPLDNSPLDRKQSIATAIQLLAESSSDDIEQQQLHQQQLQEQFKAELMDSDDEDEEDGTCEYDLVEINPRHPNFQQIREYLRATQDVEGLINCLQYY